MEVWTAYMWVMIDLPFYFTPKHLRTIVVKIKALVFSMVALLADYPGAFAVRVDTNCIDLVTIWAVRPHILDCLHLYYLIDSGKQ
jgi:hypothetical protein